mmetsp:Transcript_1249/g.2947  ORF Transcript_1249/g.2947 Transcript_1249/m.2947 type:complete len:249 (-) Transcript_1249:658-1404(-)
MPPRARRPPNERNLGDHDGLTAKLVFEQVAEQWRAGRSWRHSAVPGSRRRGASSAAAGSGKHSGDADTRAVAAARCPPEVGPAARCEGRSGAPTPTPLRVAGTRAICAHPRTAVPQPQPGGAVELESQAERAVLLGVCGDKPQHTPGAAPARRIATNPYPRVNEVLHGGKPGDTEAPIAGSGAAAEVGRPGETPPGHKADSARWCTPSPSPVRGTHSGDAARLTTSVASELAAWANGPLDGRTSDGRS